jgi:hypothetical protein
MTTPHRPDDLVHFLDGLRCIWCHTLNASWLWADGATVECSECGQTSLTTPDLNLDPDIGPGHGLGVRGEGT